MIGNPKDSLNHTFQKSVNENGRWPAQLNLRVLKCRKFRFIVRKLRLKIRCTEDAELKFLGQQVLTVVQQVARETVGEFCCRRIL